MAKKWYILWGVFFILCAGLGFIQEPAGFWRIVLIFLGILFFLPPIWLLQHAKKTRDKKQASRLCKLSAISLGATLLLLIANMLSATASETAGNALYVLLGIVSCPMFCCRYWVLGLFGWACVLMMSISILRKKH